VAVVVWWAVCLAFLIGLGRLVARFLGREIGRRWPLSKWAWIGLTAVIAWAFTIHLIVPLRSPVALLPIALGALAGWFIGPGASAGIGPLGRGFRSRNRLIILASGLFLLVVLLVANFALGTPTNYDTYLYHLASIQHYSAYPVIEGLANFHHRFGFQSGTLAVASLMEPGPILGEGFRLVNGLLLVVFGLTLLERVAAAVESRELAPGTSFLLVAAVIFSVTPGSIDPGSMFASPSLDIGTALALIAAMAAFIDAVCDGLNFDDVLMALMLAALAAAFRPQSLILLAGITLVLGVLWLRAERRRRELLILLAPVAVLTGAWMLHSLAVSGYPVFPFRFPDLGLAWAVPASAVESSSALITRHGARSGGPSPALLADPAVFVSWFGTWIDYLRDSGQLARLFLIFLAAAVSLAAMVISKRRRPQLGRLAVISLPAVATLLFWLFTSPLIRYGLGPIVAVASLPISAALFGLNSRSVRLPERLLLPVAALFATLLVAFAVIDYGSGRLGLVVKADGDRVLGAREPKPAELRRVILPGGRWSFTPAEGSDQCGEEFRCTPESFRGVRFRGKSFEDGLEAYP